ncbi:MAG: DUF4177 domain-containing protein [Pseudomonadota bacterium]
MPRYEYKVIPAPTRGRKGKGIKGAEARFAHALEGVINTLAEDGWEYQRTDTLPSTERIGLASTSTHWRNMLIFKRIHPDETESFMPERLPPPQEVTFKTDPDVLFEEEMSETSSVVDAGDALIEEEVKIDNKNV